MIRYRYIHIYLQFLQRESLTLKWCRVTMQKNVTAKIELEGESPKN